MTPEQEGALVSMARPLGATNASRDAIRLAIRAAVAAERERAAGIADDMAHGYSHGLTREEYEVLTDCADAIRRGE